MCYWLLSAEHKQKRPSQRRYAIRRRNGLIAALGGKCEQCGAPAWCVSNRAGGRARKITGNASSYARLREMIPLCPKCIKAWRVEISRRRIRHGSRGGYDLGCRCLRCTRANTISCATQSARTAEKRAWAQALLETTRSPWAKKRPPATGRVPAPTR